MRWLVRGTEVEPPRPRRTAARAPGRLLVPLALEPSPSVLAAAARGRLASLASTDRMEPPPRPLRCPHTDGRVVIELYSGQVYPDRCRSSHCDFCLPLNARRRCIAITAAGPQRMIRLSLVAGKLDGSPCATALTRVGLIRRNVKRIGRDPGKWCWTIERNPKGTGYHAHCLQVGPSIPQDELQDCCERAGAGIPYINAIRRTGQWTSRYGLKSFGADGYGLKSFRPDGDPKEALRINHGRLEHHSRGFYEIDGDSVSPRQMEAYAISILNEGKRVAFIGCLSTQVNKVLDCAQTRERLINAVHRRVAGQMRALA